MSASIPQQDGEVSITLTNLNEQVGNQINAYIEHLEMNSDADLLTDLQGILVDVISLSTVAYIAADKLIEQGGVDSDTQDA